MKLLKTVQAHCDVPCGIYETDTVSHAAETCRRMVEMIENLGPIDNPEKNNTFVRCVMTKEKYGQRVKDELSLLWSDYFKPEHLTDYPDLHDTFWKTIKQASKVKQGIAMDEAIKLNDMVHEIAHLFAETKQSH
jgi:nickel superoxide dismutase